MKRKRLFYLFFLILFLAFSTDATSLFLSGTESTFVSTFANQDLEFFGQIMGSPPFNCTTPGITCDSSNRIISIKLIGSLNLSLPTNTYLIIPNSIENLGLLKELVISNCYLSGTIPTQIFQLSNLEKLDLHGNHLTGNFPEGLYISKTPNLGYLNLGSNNLLGSLPASLPNTFQYFNASNNFIAGSFPLSIYDARQIDISNNLITGTINLSSYPSIAAMMTLLNVSKNKIRGFLPAPLSLGSKLYLAYNEMSCPSNYGSYGTINDNLISQTLCQSCLLGSTVIPCNGRGYCGNSGRCVCNSGSTSNGTICVNMEESYFSTFATLLKSCGYNYSEILSPSPCPVLSNENLTLSCDPNFRVSLFNIACRNIPRIEPEVFEGFSGLGVLQSLTIDFSGTKWRFPSIALSHLLSLSSLTSLSITNALNDKREGIYQDLSTPPLPSLSSLVLRNCSLFGTIPINFNSVSFLDLRYNRLSGSAQAIIYGSPTKDVLLLSDNELTADLRFQNASITSSLSLANNKIRCDQMANYSTWSPSNDFSLSQQLCTNLNDPSCGGINWGFPTNDAGCLCVSGFYSNSTSCQISDPDNLCGSNYCLNGANCTFDSQNRESICHCQVAYSGERCDVYTSWCNSNPCMNSGTCFSTEQFGYACQCPSGFAGYNCEIQVFPCDSQPCLYGSTCSNLISGGFSCQCPSGYSGYNCGTDVNECLINAPNGPCLNGGLCYNTLGSFICQCPGVNIFSGPICEDLVNYCTETSCAYGTCSPIPGGVACGCISGFTGPTCSVDLNECEVFQGICKNNGTCINSFGSYSCNCQGTGFSGFDCTIPVNECLEIPCANNGTCIDNNPGFSCLCSQFFNGSFCEINIDDCARLGGHQTCLHGSVCVDGLGSFTCDCTGTGYGGEHCEIYQPACTQNAPYGPCLNKATCLQHSASSYTCDCLPGFSGNHCEIVDSQCSGSCLFGEASCETSPGRASLINPITTHESETLLLPHASCTCEEGFTGKNCSFYPYNCLNFPCQNGGICGAEILGIHQVSDRTCLCPPGYNGLFCENKINHCAHPKNPCENGATCFDFGETYFCSCRPPFSGRNCSHLNNPCMNTELCPNICVSNPWNGPNSYLCVNDQSQIPDFENIPCMPNPCLNGGSCRFSVMNSTNITSCDCFPGFFGSTCQYSICHPLFNPCSTGLICVLLGPTDFNCLSSDNPIVVNLAPHVINYNYAVQSKMVKIIGDEYFRDQTTRGIPMAIYLTEGILFTVILALLVTAFILKILKKYPGRG